MKKLLILGSDFGTLDIAKKAKKLGHYVVTADLMKDSFTKKISDESWLISTADIETLEDLCRKNKIDGIIAGASDFNNEKAKILAQKLRLPTPYENPLAEEAGVNKRLFKNLCIKCGVPVAKDFIVKDINRLEDVDIVFPVVVKPIDASGNRGMNYCSNYEQLREAIQKAHEISSSPDVIVERELNGPEYAVHYIVRDGQPYLYYFASEHNEPGQRNNMYSLVTTTSTHLKQYLYEMNEGIKEVFRKAGCTNGIAWIECIRDTDGHFYCFEMGYRFGATMLYSNFEEFIGYSALEFMINFTLGETTSIPVELSTSHTGISASYHLFMASPGVIGEIKGLEDIEKHDNIIIDMPKREGTPVQKGRHLGVIRMSSKNVDELISTLRFINSRLRVNDEKGRDLLIHFTDYNTLQTEAEIGLIQ